MRACVCSSPLSLPSPFMLQTSSAFPLRSLPFSLASFPRSLPSCFSASSIFLWPFPWSLLFFPLICANTPPIDYITCFHLCSYTHLLLLILPAYISLLFPSYYLATPTCVSSCLLHIINCFWSYHLLISTFSSSFLHVFVMMNCSINIFYHVLLLLFYFFIIIFWRLWQGDQRTGVESRECMSQQV